MTPRLFALLILSASPAWAQHIEITPLVTYRTSADIEQKAAGVEELAIDGGVTWGAQATWFVTSRMGVEALWTTQSTAVSLSTTSGSAELFRLRAHQILANFVVPLGGGTTRLRPFVFGGVGATVFDAPALERETHASWTIGGGVTWLVAPHVGVKTLARYTPTVVSDTSSRVCDPFGFCQGTLNAFEVAGGAAFRF